MTQGAGIAAFLKIRSLWPWLVLALLAAPAFWHVVDFPEDADAEYPPVVRPTFSRRPPPAYRLAEPGDTIERVAIYVSAGGVVLALAGLVTARQNRTLWLSAVGLALAALWHGSTPGPTFDGWHGLGWRAIAAPGVPLGTRVLISAGAFALGALILVPLIARRTQWRALWHEARERQASGLLIAAAILVALRQVEIPNVEPVGYWPRWFFDYGIVAFDLALVRLFPALTGSYVRLRRLAIVGSGACLWFGLVVGGIWVTWYHRPLNRLRTVVPGRIYVSAMPTELGLEVAQARHGFKTIINLFPEDTPFRHERLPEELRFVKRHNIRYLGSPSDDSGSTAFLDETLQIAQDPTAWPILVHCHGCMDRTPAWMGIYRFVVQGRPLDTILQEIERHRGYRPKASVILLYNRVLPSRAPEHYKNDPTAALLKKCAKGIEDVPTQRASRVPRGVNPKPPSPVSQSSAPRDVRPNLTPPRRSLEYPKTSRDPQFHESASPS